MKGFSLLSLVAVCALVGLLYFGYLSLGDMEGSRPLAQQRAVSAAGQAMTCRLNRQSAEKKLLTWELSHPAQVPSLARMRQDGEHLGECPEGGAWKLEGKKIFCTRHANP